MRVVAKLCSIVDLDVDAIINPANSLGIMSGGLAGVIKEFGGQEIEDEAVAVSPIPVGSAVVTCGGSLPCKNVIHAPTMERPAQQTDVKAVAAATLAALRVADEEGMKTLAILGMGTGVGRVSCSDAASVIVKTVFEYDNHPFEEVFLVDVDSEMVKAFERELDLILP